MTPRFRGAVVALVALAAVASCAQSAPTTRPTATPSPATSAGAPAPAPSRPAPSSPAPDPLGTAPTPSAPTPTAPTPTAPTPVSPTPAVAGPATLAPRADLQPYYSQHVRWTACGDGAQCARITVPLDYADLARGTITLALNRIPATGPGAPLGSLVVNPGGPGGSGLQYAQAAQQIIDPAVRARYAVVGFDPRGVGQSTPVSCLPTAALDAFVDADPAPSTTTAIATEERVSRVLADGCAARSARILPYLGTDETDRDLDVIRAVLGQTRLTYLGKSYGTYLGATYAQLFPGRVGRFVLDGAVDPTLTADQLDIGQAGGFQTALTAFLTQWVAAGDCPLGTSVPAAQAKLIALLDGTRTRPLPTGQSRRLTIGEAFSGVLTPLYAKGDWPVLQAALTQFVHGDGADLLLIADSSTGRGPVGYEDNSESAFWATSCLDRPFPDTDARIRAQLATFEGVSPVFGAALDWGSLPCRYWHAPPTGGPRAVTAAGAPPILVVGTTRDPATPYAWARSLAAQLDSGVFLGRVGDGHTAYVEGNSCIDTRVDSYLLTGSTPPDGTVCADPSATGGSAAADPTASAPGGVGLGAG